MPVEFYYGDPPAEPCDRSIEIVCSAYRRPGPLRVLIQSFLNQEVDNWRLQVLHDGPDDDFNAVQREFAGRGPISFWSSDVRHNDYGHSLRAHGLAQSTGDYVLITNDDNYYVPRFLPFVNGAIAAMDPDVVVFDMVHSHKFPGGRFQLGYQTFETCMRVGASTWERPSFVVTSRGGSDFAVVNWKPTDIISGTFRTPRPMTGCWWSRYRGCCSSIIDRLQGLSNEDHHDQARNRRHQHLRCRRWFRAARGSRGLRARKP